MRLYHVINKINRGGIVYGINFIEKGQKVDLTKTNPGLSKVLVGLGWDTNRYDGQADFDLDVSIF